MHSRNINSLSSKFTNISNKIETSENLIDFEYKTSSILGKLQNLNNILYNSSQSKSTTDRTFKINYETDSLLTKVQSSIDNIQKKLHNHERSTIVKTERLKNIESIYLSRFSDTTSNLNSSRLPTSYRLIKNISIIDPLSCDCQNKEVKNGNNIKQKEASTVLKLERFNVEIEPNIIIKDNITTTETGRFNNELKENSKTNKNLYFKKLINSTSKHKKRDNENNSEDKITFDENLVYLNTVSSMNTIPNLKESNSNNSNNIIITENGVSKQESLNDYDENKRTLDSLIEDDDNNSYYKTTKSDKINEIDMKFEKNPNTIHKEDSSINLNLNTIKQSKDNTNLSFNPLINQKLNKSKSRLSVNSYKSNEGSFSSKHISSPRLNKDKHERVSLISLKHDIHEKHESTIKESYEEYTTPRKEKLIENSNDDVNTNSSHKNNIIPAIPNSLVNSTSKMNQIDNIINESPSDQTEKINEDNSNYNQNIKKKSKSSKRVVITDNVTLMEYDSFAKVKHYIYYDKDGSILTSINKKFNLNQYLIENKNSSLTNKIKNGADMKTSSIILGINNQSICKPILVDKEREKKISLDKLNELIMECSVTERFNESIPDSNQKSKSVNTSRQNWSNRTEIRLEKLESDYKNKEELEKRKKKVELIRLERMNSMLAKVKRRNSCGKPKEKCQRSLCRRFTDNPLKFFTETPTKNELKALNLPASVILDK